MFALGHGSGKNADLSRRSALRVSGKAPADQNMPSVRTPLYLAKEVEARLGVGQVLLEALRFEALSEIPRR